MTPRVNKNNFIRNHIGTYLSQMIAILGNLPGDELEKVIQRLEEARWKGQTVFTCGNGGSAVTSIHFASDLSKGASAKNKPVIKSKSLCDNIALLTAWANDSSYDEIFTQTLSPWIKEGDVLIAISGSGNSRNVLNAVDLAKKVGATTIGFTGFDGGKLKDKTDLCIIVPSNSMEQIEDIHMLLCHLISTCLRGIPVEDH